MEGDGGGVATTNTTTTGGGGGTRSITMMELTNHGGTNKGTSGNTAYQTVGIFFFANHGQFGRLLIMMRVNIGCTLVGGESNGGGVGIDMMVMILTIATTTTTTRGANHGSVVVGIIPSSSISASGSRDGGRIPTTARTGIAQLVLIIVFIVTWRIGWIGAVVVWRWISTTVVWLLLLLLLLMIMIGG